MELSRPDRLPPALQTVATSHDLVAGQVLFHNRDPARAVFAVAVGRLRLVRYTSEGNLVVFQVVRPTESFAESALFSDIYHCDAIAEVPSRVISYPKHQLLSVLHDRADLTVEMLKRLDEKSQFLKILLELRSIRSAKERVLQYLLVSKPPGETTVIFDRPFKYIAGELGLSPEVLYRMLAQLEKEGIITRAGREVSLRTPAA